MRRCGGARFSNDQVWTDISGKLTVNVTHMHLRMCAGTVARFESDMTTGDTGLWQVTSFFGLCKQVAQLSQRDRAAGWVSYGQKWKTGTGRQYLRTI